MSAWQTRDVRFLIQCIVANKSSGRNLTMSDHVETWVVYLMTGKKTEGIKAVCEKAEWDAMEKAQPGLHHLIQGGIANEAEAELLARGVSGDPKPRNSKPR